MKKASIYDFTRLCKSYKACEKCPLWNDDRHACAVKLSDYDVDEVNKVIVDWCEEHPLKTRQSKFLAMFPAAEIDNGVVDICPRKIESYLNDCNKICSECKQSYWLEEVK